MSRSTAKLLWLQCAQILDISISNFNLSDFQHYLQDIFAEKQALFYKKNSHPNFSEHWSHRTECSFTTQTVTTLI